MPRHSTIAYLTLPGRFRSDGAALFSMFRNVSGSIGISLSSAAVVERRQADQAHLSRFTTPLYQGYNEYIQKSEAALRMLGRAPGAVHDMAVSHTFQTYQTQAAILAYGNVFQYCAIVAALAIPLCFFISARTAQGGGAGGH
jgi:MFS transporter, DHA2 family, multidrug resistance protein